MNPEEIIDTLNLALRLDRRAISSLIDKRVQANQDLIDSLDFQCTKDGEIGILGILNAFMALEDLKIVANYYEGNIEIQGFSIVSTQ